MLYNLINKKEYYVNSIHSMIALKEDVESYAEILNFETEHLL